MKNLIRAMTGGAERLFAAIDDTASVDQRGCLARDSTIALMAPYQSMRAAIRDLHQCGGQIESPSIL